MLALAEAFYKDSGNKRGGSKEKLRLKVPRETPVLQVAQDQPDLKDCRAYQGFRVFQD